MIPARFPHLLGVCLLFLASAAFAQTPSLHGVVTDPSGASIAGASVQLRGPAGSAQAKTDANGQYTFNTIKPGTYSIRVTAKGFGANSKDDVSVNGPVEVNIPLTIEAEAQVVNVQDSAGSVSA